MLNPMKELTFFDCKMHALSMADTVAIIKSRLCNHQFTQHVVVNVAKLVNMRKDPQLKASVEACDIVNIDGMGVVLGARFLGNSVPERVAGVDLFYKLIELAEADQFPVFLLGATEEVVAKTASCLQSMHPELKLAGFHHGYFFNGDDKDEKQVVEKIKASGAKMLFVAISSPKKENFINQWKDQLGVGFVMGVGGTFDVVAGKVNRAPLWMQRYGLEWLYRVIQEPRRMWKRYLVTNAEFAVLLIRAKLSSCRASMVRFLFNNPAQ